MKTRVSSSFAAALFAGLIGTASAADSSERTSMPDACSGRDANCVINDGAPPQRATASDDRERTTRPSGPKVTPSGIELSPGGDAERGQGSKGGSGRGR